MPQDRNQVYKPKTEDEEKFIGKLQGYIDTARQHKQSLENYWRESHDLWLGNHWTDIEQRKKKGKRYNEAVINRVLPAVDAKVALMTGNDPTGIFSPIEPSDREFATDLELITHKIAKNRKFRTKLIRSAYGGGIYGWYGMYVYYNEGLKGGPDIDFDIIHRHEIIMDKRATSVDDATYVGTERMVELDYLVSKYPEHKDILEQLVEDEDIYRNTYNEYDGSTYLPKELGHVGKSPRLYRGTDSYDEGPDKVKVVTIWHNDYTEEEYEIPTPLDILKQEGKVLQNPAGNLVYNNEVYDKEGNNLAGELYSELNPRLFMKVSEPAYPFGRRTVLAGDQLVLEDDAWFGKWPIAIGVTRPIPGRWYGYDDPHAVREQQHVVNEIVSSIQDHVEATASPRRKAEVNAVVDKRALNKSEKNGPNSTIWLKDGKINAFDWDRPAQMSQDAWNLAEFTLSDMDNTVGTPSTFRGQFTEEKKTATEISTVERAAHGRMNIPIAFLDEFVSDIFCLIAQAVQEYYEPEKIARMLGKRNVQNALDIANKLKTLKFDVDVEAGNTLPLDKEKKKQDAVEINTHLINGGPYLPEILDAYEVNDKQEILQRSQAWSMFMQYKDILQLPQVQQMLNQAVMQLQGANNDTGQPRV
jgi:hypothetical protein